MKKILGFIFCLYLLTGIPFANAQVSTWYDYDGVELRALDKTTARATTFKAKVGQTLKFGEIFVKVRACRKPPSVEKEESASFIQVWEKDKQNDESQWVFSGWMFASSPALSAMDHPVYDVWVIGCTGANPEPEPEPEEEVTDEDTTGEAPVEQSEINEDSSDTIKSTEQEEEVSETDKLIEGLIGDGAGETP